MAEYTPTVWQDGDAITAEKLNKIENRIEEIQNIQRVFQVNKNKIPFSINLTFNDAKQMIDQGIFPCLIFNNSPDMNIDYIMAYDENELSCTTFFNRDEFSAETENSQLQLGLGLGGGGR